MNLRRRQQKVLPATPPSAASAAAETPTQLEMNTHVHADTTATSPPSDACPMCGKVFKSKLGLAYHVRNKVCESAAKRAKKKQKLMTDLASTRKPKTPEVASSAAKKTRPRRSKGGVDNQLSGSELFPSAKPGEAQDPSAKANEQRTRHRRTSRRSRSNQKEDGEDDDNDGDHVDIDEMAVDNDTGDGSGIRTRGSLRQKKAASPKAPVKGSVKTKSKTKIKGKTFRKIRGPEDARTCPTCKRVFTSSFGCKYHIAHSVCHTRSVRQAQPGQPPSIILPNLQPGDCFVTKFGVVKVIADDRATSTAVARIDPDAKVSAIRSYQGKKSQWDRQMQNLQLNQHLELRARRLHAKHLEEADSGINTLARIDASIRSYRLESRSMNGGASKRGSTRVSRYALKPLPPPPPDPRCPPDSFPNRIVECVAIPDERKKVVKPALHRDDAQTDSTAATASAPMPHMRLYLQRHLLTVPYKADTATWSCGVCAQVFTSEPGLKYHNNAQNCKAKGEKIAKARQKRQDDLQARLPMAMEAITNEYETMQHDRAERDASAFAAAAAAANAEASAAASAAISATAASISASITASKHGRKKEKSTTRVRTKRHKAGVLRRYLRKKKKREAGVYPEVMIALGFEFVNSKLLKPRSPSAVLSGGDGMLIPAHGGTEVTPTTDAAANATVSASLRRKSKSRQVVHPDEIRRELLARMHKEQRKAADDKHGSMYKGVFRCLGFDPLVKPKSRRKKRRSSLASPKRRGKKAKGVGNASETDVNAATAAEPLVEAIPVAPKSKKPPPPVVDVRALLDEVKSGRYPSMKKFTEMHTRSVCILCNQGGTLYCCDFCDTVEHFHCLLTRFRVKQPEPDDEFMCHRCMGVIHHRRRRAERRRLGKLSSEPATSKAIEDAKAKLEMEPGMEYEYLAARGQELSELLELLKDAKSRLGKALQTSKFNDMRRQMLLVPSESNP